MVKKGLFILVLAVSIAGGVFARDHKHESFDMLIGLNLGMGVTTNIGDLFSGVSSGIVSKGNYALTADFGLTYDFYLFPLLSFNTGLLVHPDIYTVLDFSRNVDKIGDIASAPLCLTIPIATHINIPFVEWLYAGIGLNFNIPVYGILDGATGVDTKGDFFIGLPIDIGFDFIRAGRGGGRLFFRATPEFHKAGTTIPIGFIWQMHNWKIHSGKK